MPHATIPTLAQGRPLQAIAEPDDLTGLGGQGRLPGLLVGRSTGELVGVGVGDSLGVVADASSAGGSELHPPSRRTVAAASRQGALMYGVASSWWRAFPCSFVQVHA